MIPSSSTLFHLHPRHLNELLRRPQPHPNRYRLRPRQLHLQIVEVVIPWTPPQRVHSLRLSHGDLEDPGAVGLQEDRTEVVAADAQVGGGVLVELDVDPLEALGASQEEMGGRVAGDAEGGSLFWGAEGVGGGVY